MFQRTKVVEVVIITKHYYQNLFPVHASSPQHRAHRQISQMLSNSPEYRDNRMQTTPPDDVMALQSISFIGDGEAGDEEI